MVDRQARDEMAVLLRRLGAGRITLGQFIDAVPVNSEDAAVCHALISVQEIIEDVLHEVQFKCMHKELPLPEPEDIRLAGEDKLGRFQRRALEQLILFLYSDLEYEWETKRFSGPSLNWWQALLWTPVLIVGLLIAAITFCIVAITTSLFVAFVVLMIAVIIIEMIWGDDKYWPFRHKKDYRTALANPRLLAGS